METRTFETGKIYTKATNEYIFRGMVKEGYHFWIRSNENEPWENIVVLFVMNDVLNNLN